MQDDLERSRIENEMAGSPSTASILDALHATRTSARERQSAMERTIREEARALRGKGNAVGDDAAAAGAAGAAAAAAGAWAPSSEGAAVSKAAAAAASQRHTVDLESLAFQQGSHFRSNKNVGLPEGSFRWLFEGFGAGID